MTMAFFLIGRGPENDVRTLSDSLFATRQEAMAELSRLSADPAFQDWDSDVFVLDLDAGVPVLLVRPQEAAGAEQVEQAGTGDADSWVADVQPQAEPPVEATESPVEAEETPLAAPELPAGPAEPTPEAQDQSPPAASPTATDDANLRDAILRTTQHMTAEGIEPPASAGFASPEEPEPAGEAGAPAEPPIFSPEEALQPEPVEPSATVAAEPVAFEPAEASASLTEEPDVPDAASESALASEARVTPEPVGAEEAGAPAWPWDSLGSEPTGEQVAPLEGAAEISAALAEPPTAIEDLPSADDSDFILDLDAIQPIALEPNDAAQPIEEPAVELTASEPEAETPDQTPVAEAASPVAEYTCEDCVYVETCPNREQRLPKDCGSFQWR
jgi:hypothetical protein